MADDLFQEIYRKNQATLTRLQRKGEQEIIRIYATALESIRKELRKIYERYQRDGRLSNEDKTIYNRLSSLNRQIERYLESKNIDVDNLLKTLTKEQYEEAFFRMSYAFDMTGGMGLNWGLIPENAVEEIINSPLDKLAASKSVKAARDGAFQRIKDDIALSLIRGDSFETLSRRIGLELGVRREGSGYAYSRSGLAANAMRIARTEGMKALNEGHRRSYDEAKAMGCDIREMWDATLDSRTRPSHGALDGQYRDEKHGGWYVPEIGGYVSGPGQSGVASFDINCRCRTTAHIDGFPPKERYIRSKSTTEPYITYSEWLKKKARQGVSSDKEQEKAIRDFQKYMIQYHQESFVTINTAGKLDGYALDLNHPKGGSHARVLRQAFGLQDGDGSYLEREIRQNLRKSSITAKETNEHGRIYNAVVPITGRNGHKEEIEVGFIVDFPDNRFDGNNARLTTVFLRGKK